MTQDEGMGGSGTPAPLPLEPDTIRPQPVPLGVPVKKRSKWPVVLVVVIVVGLLGTCVGSIYLISSAINETIDYTGVTREISPSYADEVTVLVAWSGEGRYAVIQSFYAGNIPTVIVWDSETETTRHQDGYVVVAVETEGAQIWLEPAEQVVDAFDAFDDPIDHTPWKLLAWRLDDGSEPTAIASAKWRPWQGTGGYTAYLEIDPLKGCMPAKLLINNDAGSGEGVRAALPESTSTYAPIGWSPSGEYFAIEELVAGDETGLLGPLDHIPAAIPDRKLLVFSAETGALVADAVLPRWVARVPSAVWGLDDHLYWVDADDVDTSEYGFAPEMKTLAMTGDVVDVRLGEGRMDMAWAVIALGSDEKGALFYTDDGRLWRVGFHDVQHSGNLGYTNSAVWDPRGGLLSAQLDYDVIDGVGIESVRVTVASEYGGRVQEVWRGPALSMSGSTF